MRNGHPLLCHTPDPPASVIGDVLSPSGNVALMVDKIDGEGIDCLEEGRIPAGQR